MRKVGQVGRVGVPRRPVAALLDRLEAFYETQHPSWPTDPYEFIVWWHCGYPASDDRCAKGWAALRRDVGITPKNLLDATPARLAAALEAGGMLPELRASRLKEIADRVKEEHGGNLRAALSGQPARARRALTRFPGIADPGADRILLFAGIAPVPAVPSNCPHVLVRLLHGRTREDYSVAYREAWSAIAAEVPETLGARQRAYLLLKKHGQEVCKRANPECQRCPVSSTCAYVSGTRDTRTTLG